MLARINNWRLVAGACGVATVAGLAWFSPGMASAGAGSPGATQSPTVVTGSSGSVFVGPAPVGPTTLGIGGGSVTLNNGGISVSAPAGALPLPLLVNAASVPPSLPIHEQLIGSAVTLTSSLSRFVSPLSISFLIGQNLPVGVPVQRVAIFKTDPLRFVGAVLSVTGSSVAAPIHSPGTYVAAVNDLQLSDLGQAEWALSQENQLIATDAITGFPNGTFRPNSDLTRAELAAVLVRLKGLPASSQASFADVQPGEWFAPFVARVFAAHLMSGLGNGLFAPYATVTRAQFSVVAARMLGLPGSPGNLSRFRDASQVPSWATGAMGALASQSLLQGVSPGLLGPNQPLTRAQLAVFMHRILAFQGLE